MGIVGADIRAITLFAQSFPVLQRVPSALTRDCSRSTGRTWRNGFPPESRTGQLSSLAGLLRSARQHGWEPGLSAQVDLFPEDYPRLTAGPPRALSEAVMAQLENPANLARFADPRGRLLAQILMNTGLRVGDGCRPRLDCIVRDGQGAPYLRYTNHKMRRDAFVPIDTSLAEVIAAQQKSVTTEFDEPTFLLPRPTRNPQYFQRATLTKINEPCHSRNVNDHVLTNLHQAMKSGTAKW